MKTETRIALEGEAEWRRLNWGIDETRPVSAWILVLIGLAKKAQEAWRKGKGDTDALHEIRKIAATAIAALDVHGAPRRSALSLPRGWKPSVASDAAEAPPHETAPAAMAWGPGFVVRPPVIPAPPIPKPVVSLDENLAFREMEREVASAVGEKGELSMEGKRLEHFAQIGGGHVEASASKGLSRFVVFVYSHHYDSWRTFKVLAEDCDQAAEIMMEKCENHTGAWAWLPDELRCSANLAEETPLEKFWSKETDPSGKNPDEEGYDPGPWI